MGLSAVMSTLIIFKFIVFGQAPTCANEWKGWILPLSGAKGTFFEAILAEGCFKAS
jgi:hypothetical protein